MNSHVGLGLNPQHSKLGEKGGMVLGRGTYQDHISWLIGQPGGGNM